MKLVVDTNEIFSFFNERSKAREISLCPKLELYSPFFSLNEIKKHKGDMVKRFSLSEVQYKLINKLLGTVIKFPIEKEYAKFLPEAEEISPDKNDSDFFALALKINCAIWSEDKELKKQSKVKVYSTSELIKELNL